MRLTLIFWLWLCGAAIYYGWLVWRCDLFAWMRRRFEYLIFVPLALIWPMTIVAIVIRVVVHVLSRHGKGRMARTAEEQEARVEALEFPQEMLDTILARALEAPECPEHQPVFSVHRNIVPSARVIGHLDSRYRDGPAERVSLIGEGGSLVELGTVVRSRLVGPFDVRLVSCGEAEDLKDADAWYVVVTRGLERGVVVLTYGSGSATACEVATRYVEEATTIDLASDFDPEAHHFGARRLFKEAVSLGAGEK